MKTLKAGLDILKNVVTWCKYTDLHRLIALFYNYYIVVEI